MGVKSNLPCEFSPWYPKKGKKYLPPLYRLVGTTSNGRLFGSTIPSPESPVPLFYVGEGRSAESRDTESVKTSEAIVWNWERVLSPFLGAGLASSPVGDCFDLSS